MTNRAPRVRECPLMQMSLRKGATMSRIKIAVGGSPIFTWTADEAAIQNVLERFPRGAHGVGLSPEALADLSIEHLEEGSLLGDRVAQEMQMMGVIWRILTAETGEAHHPGKIGDYAANTDFDIDIEFTSGGCKFHVESVSKYES